MRRPWRRAPGPLAVELPPALADFEREGAVALDPATARAPGELAAVVPPFRRGSGGHATIVHLLCALEQRGWGCSVWLDPPGDAAAFRAFFGAPGGGVHGDLAAWRGADVALATGWQTAYRVLRLTGARSRAYLVQDDEPEFFGASAERLWAQRTYELGLPCIAASPWLAGLLRERHGARASAFDLGVDHDFYRPDPAARRREDLVVFYARPSTPRRATGLGLLALEELHRRRPEVEIALFGEQRPVRAPFAHRHLGVLDGPALARLYREASAGLVLSLTNPSLVPVEMLACGLAVVDVASESMRATFGEDGPVRLAAPDPGALAGALERALDGGAPAGGAELAAQRTWARAAEQVDAALRGPSADRHPGPGAPD